MSRPIYTARVTQIEAFRKFMWGQTEQNEAWINEANVIATLKGIESKNVKADYGSAGHSLIENAKRYRADIAPDTNEFNTIASASDIIHPLNPIYGYRVKEFTFTDKQVQPLLKHAAEHPHWVREVPLSKLYHLKDCDLVVTGTTDAIEGLHLRDTKFKFSTFDLDEYYQSIQWRLYLHMISLDVFHYDFFRVKGFECIDDCAKAVIGECESMPIYRYPEMEADIYTTLNEFMDFVVFKGLTPYLTITPAKYNKILKGDNSLKSLIQVA